MMKFSIALPISTQPRHPWRQVFALRWPVTGAANSISALDGLRGVAVLLVVAFHLLSVVAITPSSNGGTGGWVRRTTTWWNFGAGGVHLFFVLSGFLLFLPYARALPGLQSYPSRRKFYIRRLLRVLPAYWFSLPVLILVQRQVYGDLSWPDVGLHAFFLHNWTPLIFYDINGPYWTMAIEVQFYLILPILAGSLYALVRTGRTRLATIGMLVLVFGASLLFGALRWLVQRHMPALFAHITFLSLLDFLGVFGIGAGCSLLYCMLTREEPTRPRMNLIVNIFRVCGIMGILLLAFSKISGNVWPHLWDDTSPLDWLCGNTLVGMGYGGILLGTLLGWRTWAHVLSLAGIRFIGAISYSLYIWNLPFYQYVAHPLMQHMGSDWAMLVLGMALTAAIVIPFSYLSYHFVERPFIGLRHGQH